MGTEVALATVVSSDRAKPRDEEVGTQRALANGRYHESTTGSRTKLNQRVTRSQRTKSARCSKRNSNVINGSIGKRDTTNGAGEPGVLHEPAFEARGMRKMEAIAGAHGLFLQRGEANGARRLFVLALRIERVELIEGDGVAQARAEGVVITTPRGRGLRRRRGPEVGLRRLRREQPRVRGASRVIVRGLERLRGIVLRGLYVGVVVRRCRVRVRGCVRVPRRVWLLPLRALRRLRGRGGLRRCGCAARGGFPGPQTSGYAGYCDDDCDESYGADANHPGVVGEETHCVYGAPRMGCGAFGGGGVEAVCGEVSLVGKIGHAGEVEKVVILHAGA